MYYPYLRGKLFELTLLRDNIDLMKESHIHPIIEPVKKDFKALTRALQTLEQKINYTLIINPNTGTSRVSQSSILEEFVDSEKYNLTIGYILDAESNIDDLTTLLDKYSNTDFSLIHYGYPSSKEIASKIEAYNNIARHIFIDGFSGKLYQRYLKKDSIERVLIRDGFKAQQKNALYPENEHFSDLHITYEDEGMNGFGDYLTVGAPYSETGGPAYAVAIHLTYINNDEDMFIYHFVSDQTDSPTDPGGKFLEALTKLVNKVKETNSTVLRTKALQEYEDLFKKKHYPGLGIVKKISMQHHLELMADYVNKAEV